MHASLQNWRKLVRSQPAVRRVKRALLWPRNAYRRLARLCAWAPIIWRDHDWDEHPLLRIIEFKLARMSAAFDSESAMAMGSERHAREMRIVIERFRRYRDSSLYCPPPPRPIRDADWAAGGPWPFRSTSAEIRWFKRLEVIERENWNAAWELIRKRGRTWWD